VNLDDATLALSSHPVSTPLIIQTIGLDPSGAGSAVGASGVSRLDPPCAVQVDGDAARIKKLGIKRASGPRSSTHPMAMEIGARRRASR
jgi:hypothetical protein